MLITFALPNKKAVLYLTGDHSKSHIYFIDVNNFTEIKII